MANQSTKAMMIDIETLDTKSSAVVIQIAAVPFTYTKKGAVNITGELDYKLPVAPQLGLGRTISEATVKFWLNDPDKQQLLGSLLSEGSAYVGESYEQAIQDLFEFVEETGTREIWTQGPTFDVIILEDMAKQLGVDISWKFYQVRDLRTVQEFVGHDDKSRAMKKANSNHNALDDCHSQIKLLQYFIKKANK